MTTETIFLGSIAAKAKAICLINSIEIGAAMKVVVSDTRGKTAQARGVQWMWYTEVANSGIGRRDNKDDVHADAKYKFARPILMRDDEDFAFLWPEIEARCEGDPEKIRYAVDHFISTEGEGFPIGEYLTDFERYWRQQGVNLTIPDPRFREWMEQREAAA